MNPPTDANVANVLGALADCIASLDATSKRTDRDALMLISKYPGCSIEQLRAPVHLSHSAAVRMVARLQDQGWVHKRRTVQDGRTTALTLTKEGTEAANSSFRDRLTGTEALLNPLTAEERHHLFDLVCKMLTGTVQRPEHIGHVCRACCYESCDRCPFRP